MSIYLSCFESELLFECFIGNNKNSKFTKYIYKIKCIHRIMCIYRRMFFPCIACLDFVSLLFDQFNFFFIFHSANHFCLFAYFVLNACIKYMKYVHIEAKYLKTIFKRFPYYEFSDQFHVDGLFFHCNLHLIE